MSRFSLPRCLGVCCLTASLLAGGSAAALDAPVTLQSFRVVPRASTLLKTGGFAGVSERYRLTGSYDFVSGPDYDFGTTPPSVSLFASFENAEVWGAQILPPGVFAPAVVIDVDELLDLEGLRGELLPLGAPFDVYRFRGFIGDSAAASPLEQSTIELYAAQLGPWQFLYGETTPPPHSADRFEYEIRALARRGPWADANDDGFVDAADYAAMRESGALASGADGVTMADWEAQFGETLPDMAVMDVLAAAASASNSTAIPEPSGLALTALLIVAASGRAASPRR